jgi:NAD(P)-dependent dehydrogenase (short-subunit alcohol dehydrogenase family)
LKNVALQPEHPHSRTDSDDVDRALLAGRSVLVAGGTGNVGRYLVRALLDRGAHVIVASRLPERLTALRSSLGDAAVDGLTAVHGDLADAATAAHLREQIEEQLASIDSRLHGVIASLGHFVAAPSVLTAPPSDLRDALDSYLMAHFLTARTFIPLVEAGGSYTFINGPLAFDSLFDGSGLVSIATAGQAMLARVLMKEARNMAIRVNEVILYTPFGWGDKPPVDSALTREDVARYIAYLVSPRGARTSGETIHLNSWQPLQSLEAS